MITKDMSDADAIDEILVGVFGFAPENAFWREATVEGLLESLLAKADETDDPELASLYRELAKKISEHEVKVS